MNTKSILTLILLIFIKILTTQCTAPKNDIEKVSDSLEISKKEIPQVQFVNLSELELSPQQYVDLYDIWTYEHTDFLHDPPYITGDTDVDNYFQKAAEERGYKLWSETDENRLVSVGHIRMQPEMLNAWNAMKKAAANDGIYLDLVSGYRSIKKQREIFNRNFGTNYAIETILNGGADSHLNDILSTRSIPGYSKHHTGYTIDITDHSIGYDFTKFKQTAGYEWIAKNNFKNARAFGFMPSYPEGVTDFGPVPEAWEYVWIGDSVSVKFLHEIGYANPNF